METNANSQGTQEKPFIPGGIAGEVHENSMQEKVGQDKFHVFVAEKIHPVILNIYKDYSVRGYFIMILVSFIAIAAIVGAAFGLYVAITR